ncbi:MAG: metalloregulator ArsR/SmtB family transcription factor [Parvularculaceae bacterium]
MEIKSASQSFAALAQETRLAVFIALIKAGPEGFSAGALAETLDVPSSTLSFHLKDLAQSGLIQAQRTGRSIIYSADYGGIRGLVGFLLEDCCQGDPRLCGPYIVSPR